MVNKSPIRGVFLSLIFLVTWPQVPVRTVWSNFYFLGPQFRKKRGKNEANQSRKEWNEMEWNEME